MNSNNAFRKFLYKMRGIFAPKGVRFIVPSKRYKYANNNVKNKKSAKYRKDHFRNERKK